MVLSVCQTDLIGIFISANVVSLQNPIMKGISILSYNDTNIFITVVLLKSYQI